MAARNSLDITQVSINESKDDARKTKQQSLELSQEKLRASFSAKIRAKITESTGARIVLPTEKDDGKELKKIIGQKNAVVEAKAELESAIEKIPSTESLQTYEEINVEPKYYGYFLARKGAVLHEIREDCGEVHISFPHHIIDGDRVVIKGTFEAVKAAKRRVLDIVKDLESMVTIECEIPRRHRYMVMGAGGCKVKAIKAEFNVCIKFPERISPEKWRSDKQGKDEEVKAVDIVSANDVVRITGQPDNAEAARQALLNLVPITIKVDVPNELRGSIIGKGGRDVKELKQKYDVHIAFPDEDTNLDYIMITGIQPHVGEAEKAILEKVKSLEASKSSKLMMIKIEVDSEYHPKINGCSGSVMAKIMADHDVAIYFPRIGDPEDNKITIYGSVENIHNARDDIMKIINELEERDSGVLGQVLRTQDKQSEISRCESPDTLIHRDIADYEDTGIAKKIQNIGNIYEESTNVDDRINFLYSTGEAEKVQTINAIPAKLDEDVIMMQEKIITELREYINDQDAKNKALKIERTKLILEIDGERQECERIIRDNKQKFDEETAKMSNTIKSLEANLKVEREEKYILAAECNEIWKRFEELLKFQLLQENREDSVSANHRKTIDQLDRVISSNNELSKTLAERDADIDRLKTIIESKEVEISKLKIDLSDALENKSELFEIIENLNHKLVSAEERISGTLSKAYVDELDEQGVTERANHAAKLQKITSNVYDLKEKLIQITQISQYKHSSSEICEMFEINNSSPAT